jgi:deazaflavin-dependent oxidoreductase (nitroreductase family)
MSRDAGKTSLPTVLPGNSIGHRVVTRIASSRFGIAAVRKVGPYIDPTLIRLTGGRFSTVTPFPALLLTHTGATSGVIRTTSLVYFTDGQRVVVVASNFGAATNPAWYHNVKANPDVSLLGRGFSGCFVAEEAVGRERDRLYRLATDAAAPYDHYQQSAGMRAIPVMTFRRAI